MVTWRKVEMEKIPGLPAWDLLAGAGSSFSGSVVRMALGTSWSGGRLKALGERRYGEVKSVT